MLRKASVLLIGLLILGITGLLPGVLAQEDANCPGAPQPHLVIGGQGRVLPGDPNNVRDAASRSGAKIGAIPGGEAFSVLEGPVCADGLNWWRVTYGDLTGWTVEGQGTEYWVESYDPSQPTEQPTATPLPIPAHVFEPPRPVVNVLASGVQARVIRDYPSGGDDRLPVRTQPGLNSPIITQLELGDLVTILDGVQEADSLIWREIKMADGRTGWAVEGLWVDRWSYYVRTLLPACPATENRLAFAFGRYIYTSNPDGSEACVMDRLLLPEWTSFRLYYIDMMNRMFWSPDRTAFAFVDQPNSSDTDLELFILSADGMERQRITHNDGGDVYWVSWSPDGQRLAIAQQTSARSVPQIWTMRADGSGYGALTSGDHAMLWAEWLADSATLVYVENIGQPNNDVGPTRQEYIFHTVNVDQGGLAELYRTDLNVAVTRLSPDRSKLLIQGHHTELIEGQSEYVQYTGFNPTTIIDLETREAAVIQGNPPLFAHWLPDSSGLVSIEYEDIMTITLPDGIQTSVRQSPLIDWYVYMFPVGWLSDSEMVLINGGDTLDNTDTNRLLAVNVEDGTVRPLIGPVQR